MKIVNVMGMEFNENSVPNFGSIYATKITSGAFKGVNEYGLNETDVAKLDLITNAAPGSTALCDDTGEIYRLTKSGWVRFGESAASTSSTSSTSSLNLSPLNLNRDELTGSVDLNETEIAENEESSTPDVVTVEPITRDLTGSTDGEDVI